MAPEGLEALARVRAPDLGRLVRSGRQDLIAIRGEEGRVDLRYAQTTATAHGVLHYAHAMHTLESSRCPTQDQHGPTELATHPQ